MWHIPIPCWSLSPFTVDNNSSHYNYCHNFSSQNICNHSIIVLSILFFQSAQPDPLEVQRQQELRRRELAKRRAKQQLRIRSPEPVDGRKHTDVQTELYLEELSDRIEEADVECQTDAFLDRPPSPIFVPAKSGVDCETQILEGEVSWEEYDSNLRVYYGARGYEGLYVYNFELTHWGRQKFASMFHSIIQCLLAS